ncbi:Prophage CP4-57 regulatory protein (AlpA) [Legionella sainthelensi]|uniref:Prophage CP4-57 regulatory protein (AlpA) n=1 Tax=Legionella sainthelensi TaxID=28087 RepID=A0A0W0YDF9_9GAMM|nr:AlpA family phage regulatory protein [Legionella sainthelensi]KTD54917.1 Prophage CP4-57 regulatory protein (AlpA) [Legionella sainthelensi]VEH37341.1 phage transcriptional regulator AlpA [Legionella sainthelensi]
MHQIPPTGYLRIKQILGNSKANPPITPLIPVGKSTWWVGVKTGRFPQPIKLGPRITVWRVEDIKLLIEKGCF